MNKYRDKSDFEINKAVAEHVGGFALSLAVTDEPHKPGWNPGIFDPCSNPADAMPIIIENGISSLFNDDEWICSVPYTEFLSINESLYRAAMEVFLMMKEAENEK